VVVVTGVTPGSIGFETANVLSQWGAKVVATVRSEESRKACDQQMGKEFCEIDLQYMNLADIDSVKSFSSYLKNNYAKLDVLINNAGIYLDMAGNWKEERLSDDSEEIHWRVNYLGTAQLTLNLLPLLENCAKENGEARVVFVSSHMHDNCTNDEMFSGLKPYKSVKAYGRSKLASMHFAMHLHGVLCNRTGVKFISLHPGSIYTNLADKGFNEYPLLNRLRRTFSLFERAILLNPLEGAQTQIMCATDPEIESGAYYRRCAKDQYSSELDVIEDAKELWSRTLDWLSKNDPGFSGLKESK